MIHAPKLCLWLDLQSTNNDGPHALAFGIRSTILGTMEVQMDGGAFGQNEKLAASRCQANFSGVGGSVLNGWLCAACREPMSDEARALCMPSVWYAGHLFLAVFQLAARTLTFCLSIFCIMLGLSIRLSRRCMSDRGFIMVWQVQ